MRRKRRKKKRRKRSFTGGECVSKEAAAGGWERGCAWVVRRAPSTQPQAFVARAGGAPGVPLDRGSAAAVSGAVCCAVQDIFDAGGQTPWPTPGAVRAPGPRHSWRRRREWVPVSHEDLIVTCTEGILTARIYVPDKFQGITMKTLHRDCLIRMILRIVVIDLVVPIPTQMLKELMMLLLVKSLVLWFCWQEVKTWSTDTIHTTVQENWIRAKYKDESWTEYYILHICKYT